MNGENGNDPIDQAIASVAADERTVEMVDVPVVIACSGRPVVVSLPVDCSDQEIIELAAWLLLRVRGAIAAAGVGPNAQRSGLVVARGSLPRNPLT